MRLLLDELVATRQVSVQQAGDIVRGRSEDKRSRRPRIRIGLLHAEGPG
jgi:hypothetical protein